jgi:transcriptional regulator with XRE-family HTH domain
MKTPPSLPTTRALEHLGKKISLTRRRRQWSQSDLAEQAGTSVSTVRRLEQGDPGTALKHLIAAMTAFGQIDALNALLEPSQDTIGIVNMDEHLPKRVRTKKKVS